MLAQYMQIKKGGERGWGRSYIPGTLNQPSAPDNIHACVHT